MPHVGKVTQYVQSKQTSTPAGDLSATTKDQVIDLSMDFPNGTGVGAANNGYIKEITISGAGNTDIDLAAGLTAPDGTSLIFTSIRYVVIKSRSTGVMTITRPASNGAPIFKAAGDGIDLNAGGKFEYYDPTGFAVTAGTGDLINVANAAGTAQKVLLIVFGVA